jgi:two-component system, NarL family, sensor histidine kinase LiaS
MFKIFRRLQWKLTFSYAVVTAGTVILLAAMLVVAGLLIENANRTRTWDSMYWSKTAFQDNIPFLLKEPSAMQTWLERVQKQGFTATDFQSYTVRETMSYANSLKRGMPIYVLDPKLNILAAAPADADLLGKPFNRSVSGVSVESILKAAQVGDKDYYAQSARYPDGSYLAAFPLRESDEKPVVAIVVYHLTPYTFITSANMDIYLTFLLVTTVIMFAVSLPVGAVFGWLVTSGLRKRLVNLSAAAQSWSNGDFSIAPSDKSGDEIGELTRALNRMAEQLQTHIHTRDELARIEERNRLARDLHDTVKQQTYAARMQLSAAKNLLTSNPQAASEHLEAALQLNRESQQELKLIIDELRPAALEGRGLAQALVEYAARWQGHTGIQVETAVTGERPLPLDIEQALYRVLQESLSNIARHAEADRVTIRLNMSSEQVSLLIADNGRGFEPAAVAPNSLGLTGMQQRLAEVGGALTVETQLAVGTKLCAEVKLKAL